MARHRGSRPAFRLLYFAAFLEKETIFMHSAEKEKRPRAGAEKRRKSVESGGEIREENVFGYSVKKQ